MIDLVNKKMINGNYIDTDDILISALFRDEEAKSDHESFKNIKKIDEDLYDDYYMFMKHSIMPYVYYCDIQYSLIKIINECKKKQRKQNIDDDMYETINSVAIYQRIVSQKKERKTQNNFFYKIMKKISRFFRKRRHRKNEDI
jgi:hypothetical protein